MAFSWASPLDDQANEDAFWTWDQAIRDREPSVSVDFPRQFPIPDVPVLQAK